MAGWYRALLHSFLAALLTLVPALVNGQPFFFYDTAHYISFGRSLAVIAHLAEPASEISPPAAASVPVATPVVAPKAATGPAHNMSLTYAGGRSPYYSFLLFVSIAAGGFWLAALLQGWVATWLVWLAWRVSGAGPLWHFYALVGALVLLSSFAFYTSFAMPDVFAAFAVLGGALLLVPGKRLSSGERIALVGVTAAATAFHGTNVLLMAVLLVFATLWLRWSGAGWRDIYRRELPIVAAVVLAVLGGVTFTLASLQALGDRPRSPPYLMARSLADGPGRLLLKTACQPVPRYAICAYRGNPLDDHNAMLWSGVPGIGVFSLADYDTRLALANEQTRFVIEATTTYPLLAAERAGANVVEQLREYEVSREIVQTRESWEDMVRHVAGVPDAPVRASLSYRGAVPWAVIDWIHLLAIALSAGFLVYRLSRRDVRGRADGLAMAAVGSTIGLTLLLLVNAAVCGILSGPSARYEARLIWLLPMVALLVAMRLGFGSAASSPLLRRPAATPM